MTEFFIMLGMWIAAIVVQLWSVWRQTKLRDDLRGIASRMTSAANVFHNAERRSFDQRNR